MLQSIGGLRRTDRIRQHRGHAIMKTKIAGPFGTARHVMTLPTDEVREMYRKKCNVDIGAHFKSVREIDLFECMQTGYRFWRPDVVSGDESFYKELSGAWTHYYRDWRWEYGPTRDLLGRSDRLLEVGCGRGYFLRSIEHRVASAIGLELNRQAIATKVTSSQIRAELVADAARAAAGTFDVVCSFQVLEHVTDPAAFIAACIECLKPGGLLVFSTPNYRHPAHQRRQDAFDLPPHHMGHFSRDVYKRLAAVYGLKLDFILEQARYDRSATESTSSSSGSLHRCAVSAGKAILNRLHRMLHGPGHTMLVAFRKPVGSADDAPGSGCSDALTPPRKTRRKPPLSGR